MIILSPDILPPRPNQFCGKHLCFPQNHLILPTDTFIIRMEVCKPIDDGRKQGEHVRIRETWRTEPNGTVNLSIPHIENKDCEEEVCHRRISRAPTIS